MIVLGVDPGGTSGLVVRDGDQLLWHATVTGIWQDVLAELDPAPPELLDIHLVAVEEIVAPNVWHNGQRRMLHPQAMIDTARVAGAVAGWAWTDHVGVIWVPPGHNGQGDLMMYPTELRPTRGKGAGHDALRHCRSAWDVAGIAALIAAGRPVSA